MEGLRIAHKENQDGGGQRQLSESDRNLSTSGDERERVKANVDELVTRLGRDLSPPPSRIENYSFKRHQMRRRNKLDLGFGMLEDEFFFADPVNNPLIPKIDEQGYEEEDDDLQLEKLTSPLQMFSKPHNRARHGNKSFITQHSSLSL